MEFLDVSRIYNHYLSSTVCEDIAPDDQMYNSGKDWYFPVGKSGLRCVLQALCFSQLHSVASILDLPCGHGRVARHLRAAFPEARMSFSDLDTSGVDFCVSRFNGAAIYSKPDLTSVALGGPYDLIWIGSLFTHVDLATTRAWLAHLVASLTEDGVLVATFHGHWSVEVNEHHTPLIHKGGWNRILAGYQETGYGYAPYDSAHPEWGISLSSPMRIVDVVSSLPGVRLLSYTERGWADNHDVVSIGKTDRNKPWQKRRVGALRQVTLAAGQLLHRFPTVRKVLKRVLRRK